MKYGGGMESVSRMRLGLLFGGVDLTIAEMVRIGRMAEVHGVDALYGVEAYRCGLLPLTALAAGTKTITIGPYVLNSAFRTPFAAGLAALDLNELSAGRLELAVGTGNAHITRHWLGVEPEPPLAKMRDYVTILRMMMRTRQGERMAHHGPIHSIDWVQQAVGPATKPAPVYLAASFPKMIRLAAMVADGLALGALVSPPYIREVILPSVREACEQADRDLSGFGIKVCAMVAADDDRTMASARARQAIAGVFAAHPHPYYEHLLREQGFAAQLGRCLAALKAGKLDAAADAIDDDVIDSLIIWGTPEDCATKLSAFAGAVDEAVIANVVGPSDFAEASERYRTLFDVVASFRGVRSNDGTS